MISRNRFDFIFFLFSVAFFSFSYGIIVTNFHIFPYVYLTRLSKNVAMFLNAQGEYLYIDTKLEPKDEMLVADGRQSPGLTLLQYLGGDRKPAAKVIDLTGHVVQRWDLDWFRVWPNAKHLTSDELPKREPGTHTHGIALMDNGDIVYNYEFLGLVRMNPCGKVIWRLPYRTSHSVAVDDKGDIWVPGRKPHHLKDPNHPNYSPPFWEPMVLQVSPAGRIIRQISVPNLLKRNGLNGLLYGKKVWYWNGSRDVLHLNKVAVFRSDMKPGVFKPGDVMISLRNISAIIVFDPTDLKVRWYSAGVVAGQHDPDFVDGNTIRVFDNHPVYRASGARHSDIALLSASSDAHHTLYTGSKVEAFFSNIMGKQQRLANGDLLITDAMQGKVFEVDPQGHTVWRYINFTGSHTVGVIENGLRLPARYNAAFFERKRAACTSHAARINGHTPRASVARAIPVN